MMLLVFMLKKFGKNTFFFQKKKNRIIKSFFFQPHEVVFRSFSEL